MLKRSAAFFVFACLLLTACDSSTQVRVDLAGEAMAERACLSFDTSLSDEDLTELTDEIMTRYGWESTDAIDTYLKEIEGTEELNELSVSVRDHLEEHCAESFEDSGLNAADLAEAIVF